MTLFNAPGMSWESGAVALDGQRLQVGGAWFPLAQLASVQISKTTFTRQTDIARVFAVAGAVVFLLVGLVPLALASDGDLPVGYALLALTPGLACLGWAVWLFRRPKVYTFYASLGFASGLSQRVTFRDARECLRFCDSVSRAASAGGMTVFIDARAVHFYPGAIPP